MAAFVTVTQTARQMQREIDEAVVFALVCVMPACVRCHAGLIAELVASREERTWHLRLAETAGEQFGRDVCQVYQYPAASAEQHHRAS